MSVTRDFAGGALPVQVGTIARIRLNAPARRNAISQAMWRALPEACAAVSAARVVIVEGTDGHFSAGADISEFETVYASPQAIGAANAAVRAGQQALADLPCPVIASVDGVCVGGGCGLALHADLRFASDRARFAITPARLGLAYSLEDTARLVQTIGPQAAKDILFSARTVDAEEALRLGLVDRVLAPDSLAHAVADYAGRVSELSRASHSVAKRSIAAVQRGGDDPEAREACEALFSGPDFAEGTAAFLAKRMPRFP